MNRMRAVVGLALGAVTVVASGAAHGATAPTPRTGTATSAVTLPTLTVTDPTGVARTVTLGALGTSATTVAAPLADLGLSGVDVVGTSVPAWRVQSAGGTQTGDHTVPVSSAVANGTVSLTGYTVAATTDSARAVLGALGGSLGTGALAAHVDLGQRGLSSTTDHSGSSGTLGVDATGIDVHLGDLLPADVLSALPLSQLVTLAQSLHLTVPTDATQAVAALGTLTTELQQLLSTAGQLSTAQQQLTALLAAVPGTQAAQQTLDAAEQQLASALAQLAAAQQQLTQDEATVQSLQAQVAAATSQVATLTSELAADPLSALLQQQLADAQASLASLQQQLSAAQATVTSDQQTVATLQQAVASAQAAVDAAQAALDTLAQAAAAADQAIATAQQLVDTLTATLTNELTQLTSAVQALPDLHALLTQLLGLVTGAPLVDLGTASLTVDAIADQTGGVGAVSCSLGGATVLGTALPTGDCAQARNAFAGAVTALHGALAALPGTATVPMPALDGLASSTTGAPAPADATTSQASAAVSPLHLGLPTLSLHRVTDTVVTSIDAALAQLGSVLPGLGLPSATSALTGALGTLGVDVGSLPTGAALEGLRTIGLDLRLAGISTTALFNRVLPSSPSTPTTPGVTPPGTGTPGVTPPGTVTPGTTTPGSPASDPSATPTSDRLPFTGANSAVEVALAALTMLLGAHLVLLGRRRRT